MGVAFELVCVFFGSCVVIVEVGVRCENVCKYLRGTRRFSRNAYEVVLRFLVSEYIADSGAEVKPPDDVAICLCSPSSFCLIAEKSCAFMCVVRSILS